MDRHAVGDEQGFDDLYRILAPELLAYAKRRARDVARAEDFVQQTFLQMHLARDRFRTGGDVFSWAFAILARLCIDGHRRQKFDRMADSPDAIELALDEGGTPEQLVAGFELATLVAHAIGEMPVSQREAYALVREQGFSSSEAAEILGTTPNAIHLRMHRTYDAVRTALDWVAVAAT
ncbi:sigma-70 family RNA polymerase sigma factor [soil metagenome]